MVVGLNRNKGRRQGGDLGNYDTRPLYDGTNKDTGGIRTRVRFVKGKVTEDLGPAPKMERWTKGLVRQEVNMSELGVTLPPNNRQAAALGRLATQTRMSGWDLNPRSLIQDNS